jgi:serine/threonine protein kinase
MPHEKAAEQNPASTISDNPVPRIENIEIIELIGSGGMALLYKARHKQLDRIVAVKVLSNLAMTGEEAVRRFQKEARLTSRCNHPNIVKTISFGISQDGQPYLVLEYLEGISLQAVLKQEGRLSLQKFKDVFLPVLAALEEAHQQGLIHRDIKPANIMIGKTDSGTDTVKLVDFGIAKVFDGEVSDPQRLTRSNTLVGSPVYMSPEQCEGKALDGRSDLYSLACVMYETLRGEPPYTGESSLDLMRKHSLAPPPADLHRKVEITEELAGVIISGLAKDPCARPQTAHAFTAGLNAALDKCELERVPALKSSCSCGKLSRKSLATAGLIVLSTLICVALAGRQHKLWWPQVNASKAGLLNQPAGTSGEKSTKDLLSREEKEYLKQKARSLARSEKHGDPEKISEGLHDVSFFYVEHAMWTEAEPLLKRRLDFETNRLGHHNDLVEASAVFDLGITYLHTNRAPEAELLLKRSLQIREKILGKNYLEVAKVLANLADLYESQNKVGQAEEMNREALSRAQAAINENAGGGITLVSDYVRQYDGFSTKLDSRSDKIYDYVAQLARFYARHGKYGEAVPYYEQSLDIAEKVQRKQAVPAMAGELADCYKQLKRYGEAEAEYKFALAKWKELGGPEPAVLSLINKGLKECRIDGGGQQ